MGFRNDAISTCVLTSCRPRILYSIVSRFLEGCAAEPVGAWKDALQSPSVLGRMRCRVRRLLGGCPAEPVGALEDALHSPSVLGRMCCTVRRFLEECAAQSVVS